MKKNFLAKIGAFVLAAALAVPSCTGIVKNGEITAYAASVSSGNVSSGDASGGDASGGDVKPGGDKKPEIKPDTNPADDSEEQKETNKKVNDLIDKAMKDKTPAEALEEIKKEISLSELASAMHSDKDVLNKILDLEKAYKEQKGINVNIEVNTKTSVFEDNSKVSVIGAALNVSEGNVNLVIESTNQIIDVSVLGFAKNVQLDISLLNNGISIHSLIMPVTITTPVPKGINIARMKLLHFYDDGTAETVRWKNNGNGTVSFTVKSFSTFVFAEEAENNNNNNNDSQDKDTTNNTTTAANNGQKTSPKTGDIADRIPYIILFAVIMGGVSVTIIKKKSRQER